MNSPLKNLDAVYCVRNGSDLPCEFVVDFLKLVFSKHRRWIADWVGGGMSSDW